MNSMSKDDIILKTNVITTKHSSELCEKISKRWLGFPSYRS